MGICREWSRFHRCHIWLLLATLIMLLAGRTYAADELPKESVLPMSLATKAVQAAVDFCKKDGYRVSASVVDRAGVLRVMMRFDGAGPHTIESSRKKAFTSVTLKRPTSHLADMIAKNPALQGLRDMDHNVLMLGGGLPIEMNGEMVGAIGVGGAPGAHLDDACAQAGLDAIGAASKIPAAK
ncbi:MAG: GlcG/HbpS family heme-binding protein [Nitrospiraceae bacterium]